MQGFTCLCLLASVECPTSDAGWSSPVARRAHNPKVVSSNLAPATKIIDRLSAVIADSQFLPSLILGMMCLSALPLLNFVVDKESAWIRL